MSQRRAPKRSQRSASPNQSQNASQLSQTTIEQHFGGSQLSLDEQVNNCVRYIVNNASHNGVYLKSQVQKICACKAGHHFQQVIEKATSILKNVYGYNFIVCDNSAKTGKAFVVSNGLPHISYAVNDEDDVQSQVMNVLLLLILTHIFMSTPPVSLASLHSFLIGFKIDVNVKHPLFGVVKDYITILIKQKYLCTEADAITKKVTISWGIRAEKEMSKHKILKFVCKMFKDCQPKSWISHYQLANDQGFENDQIHDEHQMELDEENQL